jgi:hypothetical protein
MKLTEGFIFKLLTFISTIALIFGGFNVWAIVMFFIFISLNEKYQ